MYGAMPGERRPERRREPGIATEHGARGQPWIAGPARRSGDKRRPPSIVNGRRSVSTFSALPARSSAEIVESNVDFSFKSPTCHAGAVTNLWGRERSPDRQKPQEPRHRWNGTSTVADQPSAASAGSSLVAACTISGGIMERRAKIALR